MMYSNLRVITLGSAFFLALLVTTVHADVQYPSGTQDFETMNVGDDVGVVGVWFTVNTSAPPELFTVLAADDVLGNPGPRESSTRWLRVTDQDASNVQNRFYSTPITSPTSQNYQWTYYVNLETTPPGGANTKPKITIQHFDTTAFANAWGVEFTSTGANLIVLGIGGAASSTPLYGLFGTTGIGQWVKLTLTVDFDGNTVSARVNNGSSTSLPINLSPTADEKSFRFCYRGEGSGNAATMLIDDVSVAVGEAIPPRKRPVPAVSDWSKALLVGLVLVALAWQFGRSRSARLQS